MSTRSLTTCWVFLTCFRRLDDPKQTLQLLLKPQISHLPSDTLSVYLQAALKVFGHWAAELSMRWNGDLLSGAQEQVAQVLSSINLFLSNDNVEVQERVG